MNLVSHPTRREVLQRSAAAGTLLYAGRVKLAPAAEKPTRAEDRYVDAHVHVWTPDTKQYPLAEGYTKEDVQPPSFTPQELFAHCRPLGVSRIVLIQMSFYGYDNSYMLDMIRKHEGVFSGVAVINPKDEPAETMSKLAERGVRGFRIVQGKRTGEAWLASEGMAEMWKRGAETRQAMCCLCQPDSFPAIGRMCRKHPDTPVVIDHYGRLGMDGKIRERDLANLCALAPHKNVGVKVSAFYALGKKQAPYMDLAPMTKRVYEAFGPQRLMWASDCPFQVAGGHDYRPSLDFIRRRLDFLSEEDKEWMLRKTAERVYFEA